MKSPNSKPFTAATTAASAPADGARRASPGKIDWKALKAAAPEGPPPTAEDRATFGEGVYLPGGTPPAERRAALAAFVARRPRPPGRPKADATKDRATIRFPPGVLERWRATGPGWQTRIGEWVARGPA